MKLFLRISLFLLLVACNKPDLFNQYTNLPVGGWSRDSAYVFTVPVSDTIHTYNINWHIRSESFYPYQNLWLFIQRVDPKGITTRDTVELMLMDKHGKWKGTGIGSINELEIPYLQDVVFPDSGEYKFKIEQAMAVKTLIGIKNLGFSIESHQNGQK